MNAWLKVLVGALFESGWALGFKAAHSWLAWILTIIAAILSFYLLVHASRRLPVGTTYAVFTGLGTLGTLALGIGVLGQPVSCLQIGFTGLLLIGVIGLKWVTDREEAAK